MKTEVRFHDEREAPILYTCLKDRDIPPGTRYGPMLPELYIIECCTKGAGSVIINGREFPFKAGEAYIVCPKDKIIYTADPITSREGVWCALDGLSVSRAITELGITSESPFLPPELFGEITALLNRLTELKEETDMGAELRKTGILYSILGTLLSTKPAKDKDIYIEHAIGYMEANYYRKISVSDIAADVGFERSYFSSFFKSRTGMSPHEYLSEIRVRKAAVLISEKGYSVTEAAETVGLNVRNFARLFRGIAGKNPKEIKKVSHR